MFICLFARTAHSFACSALLALFTRATALTCLLVHSLNHSRAHGTVDYYMAIVSVFLSILDHSDVEIFYSSAIENAFEIRINWEDDEETQKRRKKSPFLTCPDLSFPTPLAPSDLRTNPILLSSTLSLSWLWFHLLFSLFSLFSFPSPLPHLIRGMTTDDDICRHNDSMDHPGPEGINGADFRCVFRCDRYKRSCPSVRRSIGLSIGPYVLCYFQTTKNVFR